MRTVGRYLRWLYRHARGVRLRLLWNVVLGLANVGLNLYFISICKRLVDIATAGGPDAAHGIALYSGITAAVILLRLAVQAANTRVSALTASRMTFIIRSELYANLLEARWTGKERRHSGDTLSRFETDVATVVKVITDDAPEFITTVVQLVAAVVFLSTMDWRLAAVLVLLTPALLIFSRLFFRKMRALTRSIRDSESRIHAHIQESLQHRVLIRSMEQGAAMEDRLDALQETEYGQVEARTRFNVFTRTTVNAAFLIGYAAAFLWGVSGIWHGTSTFGTMTAFLQLVGQIQRPTAGLTRQLPSFIYATASIDRLMELEDAPKEESGAPVILPGPLGVRVEHLSFRYPDGEGAVLRDLSFDFAPGSRTAIVGGTGAGKSTLIRLMLALLEPSAGGITLYGPDRTAPVSPRTRGNFVYVPQGNTLLSGTIRDNLLLGDPAATPERMRWALRTACADFVDTLPDGLDSVCGEGGAGLSEGQAQRIAIARGLLRPGTILLLDEFSASLDPETEARLVRNVADRTEGKTLIFITHRERIASSCDALLHLVRL